jgi:4a-hydroxytetrahydrobiopterin dehydratase
MSKDIVGWLNYAPPRLISGTMPKPLSESEIKSRLLELNGWKHEGDFITKTFEFDTFTNGIQFINRLARVAEEKKHHPDIHVRYTTVKLAIQTHSAGGITKKDFDLAASLERIPVASHE